MTQRFSFYEDLTVAENLDFVAAVYELDNRREAVRAIIDRMGLADRADQLAGELSGGWKQRLALAACVLHKPKLLLLDEPTAGVDAKARREFWDLIHDMAADGLTVLVSTHYMDEAERCARIVYLSDGKLVVQGTPDEVAQGSGLVTFEATGADLDVAARTLRGMPGVEAAAVFGSVLRIAGMDRAALEQATKSLDGSGALAWHEVDPRLEDVFIHLLSQPDRDQPHDRLLLPALPGGAAQGMDPGAARPVHAAHDHRLAGDAAVSVRLRDQRRSETPADRAAFGRPFQIRADASSRRCRTPAITTSERWHPRRRPNAASPTANCCSS